MLQIDFTSLIDVRVINRDEADPMTVNGSQAPVNGQEAGSSQEAGVSMGLNHNTEVTPSLLTGIYDLIDYWRKSLIDMKTANCGSI